MGSTEATLKKNKKTKPVVPRRGVPTPDKHQIKFVPFKLKSHVIINSWFAWDCHRGKWYQQLIWRKMSLKYYLTAQSSSSIGSFIFWLILLLSSVLSVFHISSTHCYLIVTLLNNLLKFKIFSIVIFRELNYIVKLTIHRTFPPVKTNI